MYCIRFSYVFHTHFSHCYSGFLRKSAHQPSPLRNQHISVNCCRIHRKTLFKQRKKVRFCRLNKILVKTQKRSIFCSDTQNKVRVFILNPESFKVCHSKKIGNSLPHACFSVNYSTVLSTVRSQIT